METMTPETNTIDTTVTSPEAPPTGGTINQVYLNPMRETSNVKAFADISYAGIQLRGLRLINAGKGPFLSAPSQKVNDKWHSPFYIQDPAVRARIQDAVVSEYERLVQKNAPVINPDEVAEDVPF